MRLRKFSGAEREGARACVCVCVCLEVGGVLREWQWSEQFDESHESPSHKGHDFEIEPFATN